MDDHKKRKAFKEVIPQEKHKDILKVGNLNVFVSQDMIQKYPRLVKKILQEAKSFQKN